MAFLSAMQSNDTLRAIEVANGTAGNIFPRFSAQDILKYLLVQLAFHNQVMNSVIALFCSFSNQRAWYYNGVSSTEGEMQEIGEGGRAEATFDSFSGYHMGVTLRNYEALNAWTHTALRNMSPEEFRAQIERRTLSDKKFVYKQIVRALTRSTNVTRRDIWFDRAQLTEYSLINADGRTIPHGNFLKDFGTNHDHLVGSISGTFGIADVNAAQTNFGEHYDGVEMAHYISRNEITRFTTGPMAGFVPAPPKDTTILLTDRFTTSDPALSYRNMFQSQYTIGRINDVPIIVVSWWIDSYFLTTFLNPPSDPMQKPLRYRGDGHPEKVAGAALNQIVDLENPQPGKLGELVVEIETDQIFTARTVRRQSGCAVQNPVGAVITYMAGASYVEPVI